MDAEPPVNFGAKASVRRETKRIVFREERDRFEVCQPIVREKSEWLGLRKKLIYTHRTSADRWDIRIV